MAGLPLDALAEEFSGRDISLMKVDVEGGECAFLRGARQTLRRHRPVLLMEVFPANRACGREREPTKKKKKKKKVPCVGVAPSLRPWPVLAELDALGYEERETIDQQSNFVFVPKERS